MLHTKETTTCQVIDEPGNYHFEKRCEDCDALYLSRLNLGTVVDRYRVGRVTQDQFGAYCYVWALLSPSGSRPEWRETPMDADVRRFARKLLYNREMVIPEELSER